MTNNQFDEAAEADRRAVEQRAALGGPLRPRSREDFDAMYTVTPPWDIDRPQRAFVELAQLGVVRGRVLDVGCGTGEHALMAAGLGCDATGVDMAVAAIERARDKARDRGLPARFIVHDALELASLGERFDTVLDSGLFHVFDDDDRDRYVDSLSSAVLPGGQVLMMCFSDRQSGDWGPRRVSQDDIRTSFADHWRVELIDSTEFEINLEPGRALAWRAAIVRT